MSNQMEPGDGLPRRARNDNLRSETARDAAFAGGEPTRALDQPLPPGDAQPNVGQPYAERAYPAEPYAAEPAPTEQYAVEPAPAIDPSLTDPRLTDRQTAVAREKEQFGGVKVGSAFFGWLAATGMAVLLTAFVAAAGTAVGLASDTDVNEAVNQVTNNGTVGVVGIVVLLVILFVSYYSGGYVAGRMARFNGARQGMMVWAWALIAAVVVALLGLIAGQQFNVLANLNSFPRIPLNEGELTTTSIIAAVVVALVALVGAVLGGLAGMRFHRKVDRAGFTPDETYSEG
ncbi:hypothetical protein [Pseudarthrobacter sulfonivorans]|jgi:hypothetical protein|uniref:hypothetical protein n=1 Tax=Pseudarthrobacter sulfonivorans TaxID=121292 RepID=UPI00285EACA6|nr:hypothetical protein [Pseudarthrobacter sulfonivorans]MDR6416857.1 putative membrane protein [Pseudarthrobacter sulfonivorans]